MRKEKLYIFLFLLLLWLPLITQCGTESELRILFIGNSYTYYNNLPHIFQSLAKSSGHLVKTGMIAKGGYTLKRHSEDPSVLDKIKRGNWDYVILQEQSVVPSVDYQFEDYMLPAVSLFEETIRTSNAESAKVPPRTRSTVENHSFQLSSASLGSEARQSITVFLHS